MSGCATLRTSRLRLRCWLPGDRDAFAAINANPRAMRFLGGPLSRERSDTLADWIEAGFEAQGYGFWAVEAEGVAPSIGITGLNAVRAEMPFAPAVEAASSTGPTTIPRTSTRRVGSGTTGWCISRRA